MSILNRAAWLLALTALPLFASTIIGGDIHELTFGPQGNPYVVEQDVFVPEGTSLTIRV